MTTNGKEYIISTDKQGVQATSTPSPSPTPLEATITPGSTLTSTVTQTVTETPAVTSSPTPIPTPTPSATAVVNVQITKIFYDGLVPSTESDEYVEITNLGTTPVDLAGWRIADIDEGYPSLTFPSYVLQSGQSVRVYTNEVHPEYGGFSFGSGKAVWNNSTPDTAALYNAAGVEVSRKSY